MKNFENKIELSISKLPHTWFIDLDGTFFKHNGYIKNKNDEITNGNVQKFLDQLSLDDLIIFTTSRDSSLSKLCEASLKNKIIIKQKYLIIYDLPPGERILINDSKPSGLKTAYAIPTSRDHFPEIKINIDSKL